MNLDKHEQTASIYLILLEEYTLDETNDIVILVQARSKNVAVVRSNFKA